MQNKKIVFVAFVIAMVALTQIQIGPVLAVETPLYPVVSGSDVDNQTFEIDGHLVADGFAATMTMDLPVNTEEDKHARVAFAVGLGDCWEEVSLPYVYFEYTPYVKEMWLKVEGDGDYEPGTGAIVDNTGTGGSSTPDFWTVLELVGLLFTAYDIVNFLFEVYEAPPSWEWIPEIHSVTAIARQETEPGWPPGTPYVDPDNPRLQTASAWLESYFKRSGLNTLNITAGAEIYVQTRDVINNVLVHEHIGTYSVNYEVEVNVGHDVAVTSVSASPTSVRAGEPVTINVDVVNQGGFTETFTVTAYYVEPITTPTPEQWETFWSMGDVNEDGYIDEIDIGLIADHIWTSDPQYDIDKNGIVDMVDYMICGLNYGLDIWLYFGVPHIIEEQTVYNLATGNSITVPFTWNTADVPAETYRIKAVASTVPGETDTADNTCVDGIVEVYWVHDVAVASVTASPTSVKVGETVTINVNVQNQGTFEEDFRVDVYRESDSTGSMFIGYQEVSDLAAGDSRMLTFYWNTESADPETYDIFAHAYQVPGETDTDDNWGYFDGTVMVVESLPPATPSTPSGPTSGYVATTYTYSTSTTDPNDDNVRYEFDWGDGSTPTTTGWYASGATATASHSWSSPGTYNVTVRAQDTADLWSGSSPSLAVNIEPTLVTILNALGFTNIEESTVETFIPGNYSVKLYAEFSARHAQNELSWYEVGATEYNLIFSGPEGNSGYVNPPIVKTFTRNSQFGLSFFSSEARYFTETSKNPDGIKHAIIYRNLDIPSMYLIGFEDTLGGGDQDYNDMVISLERNLPPETPSTPSGPTSGYRNVWYTYYTNTTDSNGDDIRYEFEFTGPSTNVSFTTGWYASGQNGSITVQWELSDPLGTYQIRVRAQDVYGLWSGWSPSLAVDIFSGPPNTPPNTPSAPSGKTDGKIGSTYTYTTSTTDPDGDNVRYEWDWGFVTELIDCWYPSGAVANASHMWASGWTYHVRVRAQDTTGLWSDWSPSLEVTISGQGGGCVAEGTLITMADGSSKPVEEIEKGDTVLGFDPTTGSFLTQEVLAVTSTKVELIENINEGALRLTTTDQPIYIRNSTYEGWLRDPEKIEVGWEIFDAEKSTWVAVTSITYEEGKTRVYDFTTDGYQTYLANSYLLMDKGKPK